MYNVPDQFSSICFENSPLNVPTSTPKPLGNSVPISLIKSILLISL